MKKSFVKVEDFVFPPSVQADLFNYLKPEYQEFMKPILRVLKKPAQEELCSALLDWLEQGDTTPPADIALGGLFIYCITKIPTLNPRV